MFSVVCRPMGCGFEGVSPKMGYKLYLVSMKFNV